MAPPPPKALGYHRIERPNIQPQRERKKRRIADQIHKPIRCAEEAREARRSMNQARLTFEFLGRGFFEALNGPFKTASKDALHRGKEKQFEAWDGRNHRKHVSQYVDFPRIHAFC